MKLKQDMFSQITDHLLQDEQPSDYLNEVSKTIIFNQYPFHLLNDLKKTPQLPKYHKEGNVWNHTMLVVDEAAKVKEDSKNKTVFMWAALLHDIGKPDTTRIRNNRITSYDHDKVGATIAKSFLSEFNTESEFIKEVTGLVRWHMQILFVDKNLPFLDIKTMKQQTDIWEVALLGLCDRLGRLGIDRSLEEENIKLFLRKCKIDNNEKLVIN